jgi:murein endopeptidase
VAQPRLALRIPRLRPREPLRLHGHHGNGTAANWGTASAVASIESAARSFYGTGNGGVALGDLSWEHGGNIGGHASHEDGMDIDVRAIRLDERQCAARGGTTWRSSNYDRAATRQLVKAVRAAAPGHIKLIYFNDPVLVREGLVTSYSGHDGHLHVRYCERGHPDSRYRCSASSSSTEADPPNVDPTLAPALTDESMPRRWR